MSISRNRTAVLILGSDAQPSFRAALEKAGFEDISAQNDRTVREALSALMAKGPEAVVTVDPAAGYTVEDVARAVDALEHDPSELYAGTPKESSGPNAAEKLYAFLSGANSALTQTTLYAMSARTAQIMVDMKSAEDTFVFNIPLQARISNIDIQTVPTDVSVPAPDMRAVLMRSFKLYDVFIRFSIAAMIAYIVDIASFGLFEVVFGSLSDEYKILTATILSRILCSLATYILNRSAVFRSAAKQTSSVPRFIILSVVQLLASWLLVWGLGVLLHTGDVGNMLLKVVVDFVIFMASFTIMRDWVFRKPEAQDASDER